MIPMGGDSGRECGTISIRLCMSNGDDVVFGLVVVFEGANKERRGAPLTYGRYK